MKPKAIVYNKTYPEALDYIREHCETVCFESLNDETYPAFLKELATAEGLYGSGLKVDSKLLDQAPKLKIVSNTSVGYDNLDIPELTRRNIMATNTPDVLDETVADTMIGLMLAAARRIPELDRRIRAGEWKRGSIGGKWFGIDMHHRTLGIIGLGRIGAAIARRARFGFEMDILYHNRSRNPEAEEKYGAVYCSLDDLLRRSDFICLMTPLTPETRNLIGKREFELMKPTAIFVNGSRGATVDEEALVEALQTGQIRAAGLDVFVQEPLPADHPLTRLDNVVLAPHIGSATHETRLKMAMLAATNLVAGLKGHTPPTLINPEVLQDRSGYQHK